MSRVAPLIVVAALVVAGVVLTGCSSAEDPGEDGTRRMAERLEELAREGTRRGNLTVGMEPRVARHRQRVEDARSMRDRQLARMALGYELLRAGKPEEAIDEFLRVQSVFDARGMRNPMPNYHSIVAAAYLRLAEQENCLAQHNRDSCLLPIEGGGVHTMTEGSRNAVVHLAASLEHDPRNLADRWLLNVAYMTLGEYPRAPADPYLIPPTSTPGPGRCPVRAEPWRSRES